MDDYIRLETVASPKDYASDQDVRWCPGCGDYSILNQLKNVLSSKRLPKENVAIVSGIGCSSRFPYYMDTYGMHTIHGRAPAVASGLKISRPDLKVYVVTGDGDALSIGGNHFLHAIRKNIDITIIMFNNRIYGLTKGQYSPTSEKGKITKSSPFGSIDYPVNALSVAIGAEATFVARSIDIFGKHLGEVLERASEHRGCSFVEVYQNCKIFNDGAFRYLTDKENRDENVLYLEHGKGMLFGKEKDKGIRLNRNGDPEIVTLDENTALDILIHNEKAKEPTMAYLLSRFNYPEFPEPIGVFRAVERPTYDGMLQEQMEKCQKDYTCLQDLLEEGETWTVKE